MCSGCRNLVGFCHLNSVYGGALQPLLSVLDYINKQREHCPHTTDTEICAEGETQTFGEHRGGVFAT